jgi:hypothetical protein
LQAHASAAIANAVFNATGRRIRELPLATELAMDSAPERSHGRSEPARPGVWLQPGKGLFVAQAL